MQFQASVYRGYLLKGDLPGAMAYLARFPEQAPLHEKFQARFVREAYDAPAGNGLCNQLLLCYQRYYRDAFYLRLSREEAEERLRAGLAEALPGGEGLPLKELEQGPVAEAFRQRGYRFLGGRTGGWYGPYIWTATEVKTYRVELPGGVREYTVNLLDGFVSRSWLDYLSFGETGTGGWIGADGVINCVRSAYDLDSEAFQVSLLKHEAQHAMDLAVKPDLPSEDLEYRAKLVELIYSSRRNLAERFAREADGGDRRNGHAAAAQRIMDGLSGLLGADAWEVPGLPAEQIQAAAKTLFAESGRLLEPAP